MTSERKIRTTLRLSKKLDEKIEETAKKELISKNSLILKAINKFIDEKIKQKERS